MCTLDNDDPCSVWREEVRTARKSNTCDAFIPPGDDYLSHFDVYDGSATSEAMCATCWVVRVLC